MMKRKTVILVAVLVISFALVNVGFAAWVLSNNTVGVHEGNISVNSVADKSVTLNVEETVDSIIFGKPSDCDSNAWFTPVDDTANENLKITVKLTVSKNIKDINVYFSAIKNGVSSDNISKAVALNLVTAPKYTVRDAEDGNSSQYFSVVGSDGYGMTLKRSDHDRPSDPESEEGKELVVVYVDVEFDWGSHFDGLNPYNYYLTKEYGQKIDNAYTFTGSEEERNVEVDTKPGQSAEAHIDAFASLWELRRLVDGISYKYTFKAKSGK